MFHSILKLSLILLAIFINNFSFTLALIFHVYSLINTSIWPGVYTSSIFVILNPLTLVSLAVLELDYSKTVHFVV